MFETLPLLMTNSYVLTAKSCKHNDPSKPSLLCYKHVRNPTACPHFVTYIMWENNTPWILSHFYIIVS